ncbi:unnamed protein product [Meloidogyne enterolobii]|uniref:Uncharacterized protein n=1 Tax=Meloidogyne enterolobii TaxID=390850 RepID=A0ACB0Z434_MELEN
MEVNILNISVLARTRIFLLMILFKHSMILIIVVNGMEILIGLKYPYPLYPRLYIYLQQKFIDENARTVLVTNKAIDEKVYSFDDSSCVRVTDYNSKLFVRAHGELDENGLDFILIYHDDPKAPIPKKIYDFGVNVIGPSFLISVHSAALKLAKERINNNNIIRKTAQRQRILSGIENKNNNEDIQNNGKFKENKQQQQQTA